jgi:hypothetical protein
MGKQLKTYIKAILEAIYKPYITEDGYNPFAKWDAPLSSLVIRNESFAADLRASLWRT